MYCDITIKAGCATVQGVTDEEQRGFSFSGILESGDSTVDAFVARCAEVLEDVPELVGTLTSISSDEENDAALAELVRVLEGCASSSTGKTCDVEVSYVLWEPYLVEEERWETTYEGEPYPVVDESWEREAFCGNDAVFRVPV